MRVSPILISNRGVLPLNKTSNVKKCYLQDEPTKPETVQNPCFKGAFTKFLTTLGATSGLTLAGVYGAAAGGAAGNAIGKMADDFFKDEPTFCDDLPDLAPGDDLHMCDTVW